MYGYGESIVRGREKCPERSSRVRNVIEINLAHDNKWRWNVPQSSNILEHNRHIRAEFVCARVRAVY